MNSTANARRLRREQTEPEKQLWLALRAGRFAGFKFRRQHPVGGYCLDFYCAAAKLCVELDGSQHGLPEIQKHDTLRKEFLISQGITELRFWNSQWQKNRPGILLEIWKALQGQTGCEAVVRNTQNHQFIPPKMKNLISAPVAAVKQIQPVKK